MIRLVIEIPEVEALFIEKVADSERIPRDRVVATAIQLLRLNFMSQGFEIALKNDEQALDSEITGAR